MKKREKERKTFAGSINKAFKSFIEIIPVLIGVLLLLGLFQTFVSRRLISSVFTGKYFQDTAIGSVLGSISAGNPVTSYIIGGELLKEGISLLAVTAFIVAWVTVGVIQFPVEATALGKRFALARNIASFILSMLVALATVVTLRMVG